MTGTEKPAQCFMCGQDICICSEVPNTEHLTVAEFFEAVDDITAKRISA